MKKWRSPRKMEMKKILLLERGDIEMPRILEH
jgi:hypothetical protein